MNRIVRAIQVLTTWQGEGKNSGTRMLLVRFKHCNKVDGFGWPGSKETYTMKPCSFCDTLVTMKAFNESEFHIVSLQEIIDQDDLSGILITGGEPTFGINLTQTIMMLNLLKYKVADVETNGYAITKLIPEVHKNKPVNFSLSPKVFNEEDLIFYQGVINEIKEDPRVTIKYVYRNNDLDIKFLEMINNLDFPRSSIYLMPEGKTRDEIINNSPIVFDAAEKYKTNFSSRDHIIFNFI